MIKNILVGLAFIAGISGLVVSLYNKNTKLMYVDMGKLYSEFDLSKELNADLDKVLKARKRVTDSLYEDLRKRTQELKFKEKKSNDEIGRLARMEEEYYYKQQQFEKENQAMSTDYTAKIWNQLNQFVEDYGKENKYTFVFGANGQGNIMYADDKNNITVEVLDYVNNRYNGKIKK